MNDSSNLIGGKAKSLVFLKEKGFNVPDFVVFTELEIENLSEDEVSHKLSHFNDDTLFAVRSSANLEDGIHHSFAGIFNTELFIKKSNVHKTIQRIFHQKYSETVTTYLDINNVAASSLSLAIVVQEMIDADVSGVAFGIDPTQPYSQAKVISTVFGMGEGLVSGKLNADTYIFSDNTWKVEISEKEQKLVFNGRELEYVHVDADLCKKSTLNHSQLDELRRILDHLEKLYEGPQDVEFCYKNSILYILQSRPITTLKKYNKHIIWDNSNIIESYPGITLPFTFSFILEIYESVYKNFAKLLGVPSRQIALNSEVFAEMLGQINGRVYYHLIHWYKALAMLPAYNINAAYMEKMMGVSEPLGVAFELKGKSGKIGNYWNLTKTLIKIIRLNGRLPKIKKSFTEKVTAVIAEYKAKDYSGKQATTIWSDYKKFKSILVNEWFPPLANDLLAMVYFGTLQKLCIKWLGNDQLHTELVVGRYSVKSVLPAKLTQEIIRQADQENRLHSIQNTPESEIWDLCKNGKFGKTGALIKQYINLYGDRSVGELKLENETFTQNPESYITVLKSYDSPFDQRSTSEPIETTNILKKLPFFKRAIFQYVMNKAAEMVADRENLRFDRTFGFGTVRMFLWEIGKKLESEGAISHFKDIFYLKEGEVDDFFNGKISDKDIQKIVSNRRIEFDHYHTLPIMPERVHQYDDELVLNQNIVIHEGQLKGIPCCAGEVIGKVRILAHPKDVKSLNGDILVTTSTDPGWISIFHSASAILVERGSTLSHAAIVSREMGIPCIVGIKGLTQMLKNGDIVKMNGKTGIVEKHEEK